MNTMKSNQAMAQFAEGNIGMIYASSWEVSLLFNQFIPKCDWGVSMPPAIDSSSGGKGKIRVDTAGWNVVNSNTKHLEEAAKVWKLLYSPDYLEGLYKNGSAIPVVNNIIKSSTDENNLVNFKEFLPGENDGIYPNTPMVMEEWLRKNLYLDALTTNQKDQILLGESDRLNTLLNIKVSAKTLNINDYYYPNFTPQDPMKDLP